MDNPNSTSIKAMQAPPAPSLPALGFTLLQQQYQSSMSIIERSTPYARQPQRHNELKAKPSAMAIGLIHKNFIQKVYEIKTIQPVSFSILSKSGKDHMPTFNVALRLNTATNNQEFIGTGNCLRNAKLNSSEQALRWLIEQTNRGLLSVNEILEIQTLLLHKLTSEPKIQAAPQLPVVVPAEPLLSVNAEAAATSSGTRPVLSEEMTTTTSRIEVSNVVIAQKNPINILSELLPRADVQYSFVSESGESSAKQFKMQLKVDDKYFYALGSNKKLAKQRCAQLALADLFNIQFSPDKAKEVTHEKSKNFKKFADLIDNLIKQKLEALKSQLDSDVLKQHYVYAAIVQTFNNEFDDKAKLICLTTGTKCINGEYMSQSGMSINDCHAEILAIRVLRGYLYDQLDVFVNYLSEKHFEVSSNEENEFLFEFYRDVQTNECKFSLKDTTKFHLYISTTPCGDGRIFAPHENVDDGSGVDSHPNRRIRGLLRAKIESGMGTIPIGNNQNVQTWDGILTGERLKVMSCSDKLCKANVLGLQGALLSHFLDKPVYFESLIIGSFYHNEHLQRALYGRIQNKINKLPSGFTVHKPILSTITNVDTRQPAKSTNKAIVWSSKSIEILNTTNGKLITGTQSQISKTELFGKWHQLYETLVSKNKFKLKYKMKTQQFIYSDVKSAATDYQNAKKCLYEAFKQTNLGYWTRKPFEQNYFDRVKKF